MDEPVSRRRCSMLLIVEAELPRNHPLRAVKRRADAIPATMAKDFEAAYGKTVSNKHVNLRKQAPARINLPRGEMRGQRQKDIPKAARLSRAAE